MATEDWSKLADYLAGRLGGSDLTIRSIWQNTEGWSMETFSLGLDYAKAGARVCEDIILRRQPVSGLLEPYDVSIEYKVLDALQESGIALPRTFFYESDPAVFERQFYAMEKVEGAVHFVKQRTDPDFRLIPNDAERASLACDFIDNLARIHRCDWRATGLEFLGDPGPERGSALANVEHWASVIGKAGYRRDPLITLAVHWLRNNAPLNDRVALVHGDYRTGNYICKDGRIRAVLDWEMVHLGDPHEDLAYVLISLWRSPPPTNWVSHLLPEKEFLRRYEQASGIAVEPKKLAYYHVLNDLKTLGIITTAANAFAANKTPDLKPGVFGTLLDFAYFNVVQHLQEVMSR